MRLSVLLAACLCCLLPLAHAEGPSRAQLELKGLTIGTSTEAMPKSVDEMDCKDVAPGLLFCRDFNETFAGQPTAHLYSFLDGKLIRVDVYNLEFETYEVVAQLMLQKFGPPDEQFTSRGPIGSGSRQRTTHEWTAGTQSLRLLPFLDRREDGRHYPKIIFFDRELWDDHWLPRSRGEAPRERSAMADDI